MSLVWSIAKHALFHPRRVAAIDDNRTYTYAKLLVGALFIAEHVRRQTDAKHVGIMLPTSGAFPMALLGCWLAGKVAVPLNYLLAKDELAYVIGDSDIDTILTAGKMLEFLGHDEDETALPANIALVKLETLDFTGVPELRWPTPTRRDDPAVILYTSGTSGRPKGVVLSHGNLEADVKAGIEHSGITDIDTFLGVLPQFHSFGLTALTLIPLVCGAKVVYAARFMPKKIVQLIRRHEPQIVMGVPSMYGALLTVKDLGPDDVKSIRLPVSGGEPLPDALFDEYRRRLNLTLMEGYGLTETSPATHWSTPEKNKRHSVGTALPGVETFVLDEHDQPLPPDTEGEIVLAGPIIMQGYYKRPDLTAEVMLDLPTPKDIRAFRTGDIGKVDEEGFLFITGRKKEMIIVGGENVFPREIEEALNHHPSVRDSAVVGKADGMRGEVVVAFVEINDDAAFDESELRSWCRDRLAQFKVPREIKSIDELPRNPTGKIMRRKLKTD